MKIPSLNFRQILGLGFAVFAAPLAAQVHYGETVVSAPVYQERVGYEDLDLRNTEHRHVLVTRIKQAARRICSNMAKDGEIKFRDKNLCSDDTYIATRPQLRRAFARADAGQQIAMRMTVVANKKKA